MKALQNCHLRSVRLGCCVVLLGVAFTGETSARGLSLGGALGGAVGSIGGAVGSVGGVAGGAVGGVTGGVGGITSGLERFMF